MKIFGHASSKLVCLISVVAVEVNAEIRPEYGFINSLSDEQLVEFSDILSAKQQYHSDNINSFRNTKSATINRENKPYLIAELKKYAETYLPDFKFNEERGADGYIYALDFENDGVIEWLISGGYDEEAFYALAHLDGENTKVFLMNHPNEIRGSVRPRVGYLLSSDNSVSARMRTSYTSHDLIYLKDEGVIVDAQNITSLAEPIKAQMEFDNAPALISNMLVRYGHASPQLVSLEGDIISLKDAELPKRQRGGLRLKNTVMDPITYTNGLRYGPWSEYEKFVYDNNKETIKVRSYNDIQTYHGDYSLYYSSEHEGEEYLPSNSFAESQVLVNLREKTQLSFGLVADGSNCTTKFFVNNKPVFEKHHETDEDVSIEAVKTFPKGEFLLRTQMKCEPYKLHVPIEQYVDFLDNPYNRLKSGFDGEDTYANKELIFKFQPYVTFVDGTELMKMDTLPMESNFDKASDASTVGNVTFSSDMGAHVGQNLNLSYDFHTPFNIVDYSDFTREKSITENAFAQIEFDFVPSEAGEYSFLLQTVSNTCYDKVSIRRDIAKGACSTYHPLTEVVIDKKGTEVARKQVLSDIAGLPHKNSYVAFNVTDADVGKPFTATAYMRHQPNDNVATYGYDHIIMDITNKSGESFHYHKEWKNFKKTLVGAEMSMKEKNVMPILTGQVFLKTPSNGFYRPFNETDFSNGKLSDEKLVYMDEFVKPLSQAELDDGDTSWLD